MTAGDTAEHDDCTRHLVAEGTAPPGVCTSFLAAKGTAPPGGCTNFLAAEGLYKLREWVSHPSTKAKMEERESKTHRKIFRSAKKAQPPPSGWIGGEPAIHHLKAHGEQGVPQPQPGRINTTPPVDTAAGDAEAD
jgi:hypothetical protein